MTLARGPATLATHGKCPRVTTPPQSQRPLHEVWRRRYQVRPYLRSLSDNELLERRAELLRQIKPHFFKAGQGYVPDVVNPLMEGFTHFLEEANIRGLDMRHMPRP